MYSRDREGGVHGYGRKPELGRDPDEHWKKVAGIIMPTSSRQQIDGRGQWLFVRGLRWLLCPVRVQGERQRRQNRGGGGVLTMSG